jgi:15-cis-phytoene synthase
MEAVTDPGRAIERRIILSYLPAYARSPFAALLDLDDRLGDIIAAARDPLIGQMRLTWWHDALCALDTAPPPAEPVLRRVHAAVLPHGVKGSSLAQFVDGWEALLAVESDPEGALAGHAADRGAALFAIGATLLGVTDPRLADAGRGWALADAHARTGHGAAEAWRRLAGLTDRRWPAPLRALSAMALAARFDLEGRLLPGSLPRTGRLLRHRLTGR